ncbi:hypothetical protein DESUT3_25400 [Desulfuromonas versatilis]|uniref:IPT/TIG domain-containing protein n=1 Tax=Desulfuromonas versatilis TaxID=2802975 RepID=A0ABN6E2T5_9BACT|nr:IPT/TIG domain-containing protein [Desulfuromonas versatilis]BCR05471.1 hypothetical protein DESUT3_25400 [Desulfuromonas versatilis]
MRTLITLLLLGLFLQPAFAAPPTLTSVRPTTVSAAGAVTITGGPFTTGTRVVLGDREIVPGQGGPGQLVFSVPPMEPGEYALFLRDGEEFSQQSFTLRVVEPTPRILSLSPSNIDACSSEAERRVSVELDDFLPGATLLLNGSALPYSTAGGGTIAFTAPPLEAGIYGVQVVNPGGAQSLPHSLWFNDIPEIQSVDQGTEYVNYYELVIRGKNFFYNSTLVVNEYQAGFSDLPPRQRTIIAQGRSSGQETGYARAQADNVFYVDCNTLIYYRYPYSTQPKPLVLQVINPDGKKSSPYQASLP